MDAKFRGKVINALRRLSYTYKPRTAAKNRQKRGPNTFECEHCEIWIYEGTRTLEKQYEILDISSKKDDLKLYRKMEKGKTCLDHKSPVIPINGFKRYTWDWHEFIEDGLFCEEDGFQVLCKPCHDEKTALETQLRKEYRQSKKKLDKS